MTFATDGGIEWEKDTTKKVLTIRPASSPESSYTSGQMKDYTSSSGPTPAPWGQITNSGWTLDIQSGVTNIGNFAFYICTGFTGALAIPDSVTSIGNNAFQNCVGFTGSLTIGNGVTSIGSSAFGGCSKFIGSLTIPNSVTSIDFGAFGGCSGFTGSLTIPAGVTSIGDYAFSYCKNFTDVKFLGEKPTLGDNAFQLNSSSPIKTYNVYSIWAKEDTFREYDYTKWNYIDTTPPKYVTKNGLEYYTTKVKTAMGDGTVTKVGKVDVGSATQPIYLVAGVPTAGISITSGTADPSGTPAGGVGSIYIKYTE